MQNHPNFSSRTVKFNLYRCVVRHSGTITRSNSCCALHFDAVAYRFRCFTERFERVLTVIRSTINYTLYPMMPENEKASYCAARITSSRQPLGHEPRVFFSDVK